MAAASLYDVLGLGREATAQDIKTAYRNAARAVHPDGATSAEDKAVRSAAFLNVKQAYEILSDPALRRRYDAGETPEELLGRRHGRGAEAECPVEPEPAGRVHPLEPLRQAAQRVGHTLAQEYESLATEVNETVLQETEDFVKDGVRHGFSLLRQRFFGKPSRAAPNAPGPLAKVGRSSKS